MKKVQSPKKRISKKEARVLVYNKLTDALSEYKKDVKAKKFETHLKKASRLFAADIAKASHKHLNGAKKTQKKATKDKAPEQQEVVA